MKISIQTKLLVLLMVLSLVPLLLLGAIVLKSVGTLGNSSVNSAKGIGNNSIADSTKALNSLGETLIKQKAVDVAKQLEAYIKSNSTLTVSDLQSDAYFSALAVQPVGLTGYTAVTDVDTLINRFHKNEKIVNTDLHDLATKLPGFWSVMGKSQGGQEISGYYDWSEADGSIKQKYMHIVSLGSRTADGVLLSVTATTYIDEFSQPVKAIEAEINKSINNETIAIAGHANDLKMTILIMTIVSFIIIIIAGVYFAQSISRPIKALTKAADRITSGEENVALPVHKSRDEVSELISAMEMLISAFRNKKS
jgi:methyl-accepting chemotaxis protein